MQAPMDQISALLLYLLFPSTYGAIFSGEPSMVLV